MIKHVMDYRVFLRNYIYENYENITIEELLDDLGIDMDTYCNLMENNEKLSKNMSRKVIKLINKFERTIEDETFLRKIVSRIMFICNTGKIVIDENYFRGEYIDENFYYSSKITFSDDMICSYVKCGNNVSDIVCKQKDNDYKIKYTNRTYDDNKQLVFENLQYFEKEKDQAFSFMSLNNRTNSSNGKVRSIGIR